MSITELQSIEQKQRILNRFVEMRSRWLTVIGENLEDDQGQILEYWRVEKADSVIILPIQGDRHSQLHPRRDRPFPYPKQRSHFLNSIKTAIAILKHNPTAIALSSLHNPTAIALSPILNSDRTS